MKTLVQDGNKIEIEADKYDVRIWMDEGTESNVVIIRRANIQWLIQQLQDEANNTENI